MYDKERFQACVDWYYANRDSLLPLYHGKFVVCADGKVVGAWSSLALAAANAVEMGYAPGTFAVQECVTEEEEARVRVYTPWVDFSKAEGVRCADRNEHHFDGRHENHQQDEYEICVSNSI